MIGSWLRRTQSLGNELVKRGDESARERHSSPDKKTLTREIHADDMVRKEIVANDAVKPRRQGHVPYLKLQRSEVSATEDEPPRPHSVFGQMRSRLLSKSRTQNRCRRAGIPPHRHST